MAAEVAWLGVGLLTVGAREDFLLGVATRLKLSLLRVGTGHVILYHLAESRIRVVLPWQVVRPCRAAIRSVDRGVVVLKRDLVAQLPFLVGLLSFVRCFLVGRFILVFV